MMILNRFLNKKFLSACFHGMLYIYVYESPMLST